MTAFLRIPLLLYGYLATEMLAPFLASFLIMNCVFFLVKLIPFLNFVLDLEIGPGDFVRLFAYLFPAIFLYSIPMSAMMGVTVGFARLSSDTEILALKASGISMYRILPPVLVVTCLLAICTAYISVKLIPLSEVSLKQLTYQLLKEKVTKGIKEHMFTEALGEVVVYVEKINKETGEWENVWVSDMRGVDNPIITMAQTGGMDSSIGDMTVTITLNNGSLHRPGNEDAQVVQFDSYQIHVPLQPPSSKNTTIKRTGLSMQELQDEVAAIDENNERKRKLLIEFHKRLVLPVGCLMISLLGLPLGLQARPGRKAIGIQAGLAIFVLYYILFTVGKTLAEEDVLPVAITMWTPNLLFGLLTLFWVRQVTNEQPLIPEGISIFFTSSITRLTSQSRNWLKGIRPKGKNDQLQDTAPDLRKETGMKIKGNAKSRVYHLPHCEFYNCKNCTIEFKDIAIAEDAGFEPCRFCQDDPGSD